MLPQILSRGEHTVGAVTQQSYRPVALVAQESSHPASLVIVINMKFILVVAYICRRPTTTDVTPVVPLGDHLVVPFRRQPVPGFEVRFPVGDFSVPLVTSIPVAVVGKRIVQTFTAPALAGVAALAVPKVRMVGWESHYLSCAIVRANCRYLPSLTKKDARAEVGVPLAE